MRSGEWTDERDFDGTSFSASLVDEDAVLTLAPTGSTHAFRCAVSG